MLVMTLVDQEKVGIVQTTSRMNSPDPVQQK